jgi:hypothetical protein
VANEQNSIAGRLLWRKALVEALNGGGWGGEEEEEEERIDGTYMKMIH